MLANIMIGLSCCFHKFNRHSIDIMTKYSHHFHKGNKNLICIFLDNDLLNNYGEWLITCQCPRHGLGEQWAFMVVYHICILNHCDLGVTHPKGLVLKAVNA